MSRSRKEIFEFVNYNKITYGNFSKIKAERQGNSQFWYYFGKGHIWIFVFLMIKAPKMKHSKTICSNTLFVANVYLRSYELYCVKISKTCDRAKVQ